MQKVSINLLRTSGNFDVLRLFLTEFLCFMAFCCRIDLISSRGVFVVKCNKYPVQFYALECVFSGFNSHKKL